MNKSYKYLFVNILSRPFDGFYEMRRRNKGSIWFVILMYVLYLLLLIVEYNSTGYIFNNNNPNDFNVFKIVGTGILPFVLFAVANYSVTTLSNGKGFLIDIIKVIGYSLLPLICFRIIALGSSWIFSQDEAMFYYIFIAIGWLAFAFYAFIGLIIIHEYTLGKAVLTLFATVAAMAIIIFIGVLFITLFQQLIGFITSVWREFRVGR